MQPHRNIATQDSLVAAPPVLARKLGLADALELSLSIVGPSNGDGLQGFSRGELVVDLAAGCRDRDSETQYTRQTLQPIFSLKGSAAQ